MLREASQGILTVSGWFAELFVSPDATNFSFLQMAIALLLIIFIALISWFLPEIFSRHKH